MKRLLSRAAKTALPLAVGLSSASCHQSKSAETPVIETEGIAPAEAARIFRMEFSRAAAQCLDMPDTSCYGAPQNGQSVCRAARYAATLVCQSKGSSEVLKNQLAEAAKQSLNEKRPISCACKIKIRENENPDQYGKRVASSVFRICRESNPEPPAQTTISSTASEEFADVLNRRLEHDKAIRECVMGAAPGLGIEL